MNIYEKLMNIQAGLKAPKEQFSKFGNYNYRSCEDILEALKPILVENKTTLIINDEVLQIGDRYYIKSTSTLIDIEKEESSLSSTAYAREDENKAKMDLSQMTGSASSYARKYSLNGLFAIDDTKDSDYTNKHEGDKKATSQPTSKATNKHLSDAQIKRLYAIANAVGINANIVKTQVKAKLNKDVKDLTKTEYDTVCEGYESLKK